MGLLGDLALGILSSAVDSMSVQSSVYIEKGDEVTINKLLDKFDDLLQRENLIVDPKISTEEINLFTGTDKDYPVSVFETKKAKLSFFFGNAKSMLYSAGAQYTVSDCLRSYKYCYFDYTVTTDKGESGLLFSFSVDSDEGFLHLIFSSNSGVIEARLRLRLTNVSAPTPSTYSDSSIGLHKLLKKIGREEIFNHLLEFAEHPYSLSKAEQERRDAEERKRQEEARLAQEKQEAEERRLQEEKERKEREAIKRKEEEKAKIINSLDDL